MSDTPSNLREAMEQAIRENPDDVSSHMALGDHLQEQGDPQGEFVQVQLALEDEALPDDERERLQQREAELLDAHQTEWVGDWTVHVADPRLGDGLPLPEPKPVAFRRGFPTDIRIERLTARCAYEFSRSPRTRMTFRLAIREIDWDADEMSEEELEAIGVPDYIDAEEVVPYLLTKWPNWDTLRAFQFGGSVEENYTENCPFHCGERGEFVPALVERMSNLEELYLFARSAVSEELFDIELPRLRVLQCYHACNYPLDWLADNPSMTNLTHLLCHPHAYIDRAYITLDDLKAIVESPYLRSLTHLRLRLADIGDEGCRLLVESGMLNRLRTLDLRHGRITDEGASLLAASPDVGNLDWLDLRGNQIFDEGDQALAATGIRFSIEQAWQPGNGVQPDDYLFNGDWE